MRRRRVRRGRWLLFFLLSLQVNLGALLLLLLLFDEDAKVVPQETVTYLDLRELPSEPEPAPPEPEEEKAPEPEPPEPKDEKQDKTPEEKKKELELEELPEPEEEKEQEPPPPEPEEEKKEEDKPTEPVHFVLEQLKMVEQPDETNEPDVPDTYDYLSNVNRDVQEQTRAELSNLQEDAVETQAAQQEPSPATKPGTAASDRIAQLEEQRSRLDRQAPKVQPSPQEARQKVEDKPKSLLAMRDLKPREHVQSQEEFDPQTASADDGSLRRREDAQDTVVRREQQARVERNDPKNRFKLTRNDMDALYGKDVEAQRNLVSQQQTQHRGLWEGPRERWQSPLENMVPEVQPGNQTALRSRKHPFARYIATIHRGIHESWAWGFLDQLDTRGARDPLNDRDLWTRLELVIRPDGTLEKVTTVRPSGNLVFDAAARETVWAVAPFPSAPPSIVSPNGKVYIHWAFHRDERACGTFGAQPFILDGSGGDVPDPNVEVRAVRGATQRLARKPPRPMGPAPPPGAPAPRPVGPAPASPPVAPGKGRTAGAGAPPAGPTPSRTADARDPEAKKMADAWLHYLDKGEIRRLAARSGLPFTAGGRVVARTRPELEAVLRSLIDENTQRPKASRVMTAAELRKELGGAPAGVQQGEPRVYAVTRIGDDTLILILEKPLAVWRVVGVTR